MRKLESKPSSSELPCGSRSGSQKRSGATDCKRNRCKLLLAVFGSGWSLLRSRWSLADTPLIECSDRDENLHPLNLDFYKMLKLEPLFSFSEPSLFIECSRWDQYIHPHNINFNWKPISNHNYQPQSLKFIWKRQLGSTFSQSERRFFRDAQARITSSSWEP